METLLINRNISKDNILKVLQAFKKENSFKGCEELIKIDKFMQKLIKMIIMKSI